MLIHASGQIPVLICEVLPVFNVYLKSSWPWYNNSFWTPKSLTWLPVCHIYFLWYLNPCAPKPDWLPVSFSSLVSVFQELGFMVFNPDWTCISNFHVSSQEILNLLLWAYWLTHNIYNLWAYRFIHTSFYKRLEEAIKYMHKLEFFLINYGHFSCGYIQLWIFDYCYFTFLMYSFLPLLIRWLLYLSTS